MKIEFISSLALLSGLNTDQKCADYFSVHLKTWQKWQRANKLLPHQIDALRSRAGFINAPGWEGFRIVKDKLYSPDGQFVALYEAKNMWLYRQIKAHNEIEVIQPDLFEQAI